MDEIRTEGTSCTETRQALCRLAVGIDRGTRGSDLARHVRRCVDCEAFVDELAHVRRWLDGAASPVEQRLPVRELERRARLSLARELSARLARDLLGVSRGRIVRALVQRMADVTRLHVLREDAWLRCATRFPTSSWLRARGVIVLGREEMPGQALALAALLDPHGLDVGLAWLGQLVRVGCDHEAHRVAERLLADVHG